MRKIEESELIINEDGSIFHWHLRMCSPKYAALYKSEIDIKER
jgi:hypothetical protein